MPMFIPSKLDTKTGVFLGAQGVPKRPQDFAFDSELTLSQDAGTNHMLTINLRVFLEKHQPPNGRFEDVQDYNHNHFIVGPWNPSEWQRFLTGFNQQANMWNNKFWLTAPAGFTTLDINVGGKTIRPNVYCALNVQVTGSAANSHLHVRVVNLDSKLAANKLGIDESRVDRDTFRSDSADYDTFDAKTGKVNGLHDDRGNQLPGLAHSTIAHEIGHALGEPHIGVTRHAPLCQMAMVLQDLVNRRIITQASVPALLRGGGGSKPCYGDYSDASISAKYHGRRKSVRHCERAAVGGPDRAAHGYEEAVDGTPGAGSTEGAVGQLTARPSSCAGT
jgi:hypothetical protein